MTSYNDFVVKGKRIVQKLEELKELQNCYQAKIAKYAVSVCDIAHGGYSKGKYTIKQYALDIGIHPKTVQNWVAVYRNVLVKLDLTEPTVEEWRKASKVNNIMRVDRTIDNRRAGRPRGSRGAYKKQVPASRVQDLFTGIDDKPFIGECHSMIQSTRHAKHVLGQYRGNLGAIPEHELGKIETTAGYVKGVLEKRDIGIAGEQRLLALMENLDEASEIINEFLTNLAKEKKCLSA